MAQRLLVRTPTRKLLPTDDNLPRVGRGGDLFSALRGYIPDPIETLGGTRQLAWNVQISTLCEMLEDEMVGMCMSYLTAQLAEADYVIECADPQKRRFFELMYGEIHRELMLAAAPALFFGFQPLVKRYAFHEPLSPVENETVWTGPNEPYVVRGIQQLHPQDAVIKWDQQGKFAGIASGLAGVTIDVFHSLWVTIGQEKVWGDMMGWGRGRGAHNPWWNKHFAIDQRILWTQMGVTPPLKIFHPPGLNPITRVPNSEYAQDVGDGIRSGATVTLPSETYEDDIGDGYSTKHTAIRTWDAVYMVNTADPGPLSEVIAKEDQRIAYAMFIPPDALSPKPQGLSNGGSSTELMGELAAGVLIQDAAAVDRHVNNFMFPAIDRANFPAGSPPVRKRTTGLNEVARRNLFLIMQLLFGRQEADITVFDMRTMATRLGMPVLTPEQQQKVKDDLLKQQLAAAAAKAPVVAPAQPNPARPPAGTRTPGQPAVKPSGNPVLPSQTTPVKAASIFGVDEDPEFSPRTTDEEPLDPFGPLQEVSDEEADAVTQRALELLQESAFLPAPDGSRLYAVSSTEQAFEAAIERIIQDLQGTFSGLLRAFSAGNAPSDTVARMGAALRRAGLEAAQLGKLDKEGDSPSGSVRLSVTERQQVVDWYATQQDYMRGVYSLMRSTLDRFPVPNDPALKGERDKEARAAILKLARSLAAVRMPMYAQAIRGEFERARARFSISKWPRSGDTECIVNCRCSLSWGVDATGQFVVWNLGEEEGNCVDCPELAAHGPYRAGEL